jgi:protein-disulfide isomerase
MREYPSQSAEGGLSISQTLPCLKLSRMLRRSQGVHGPLVLPAASIVALALLLAACVSDQSGATTTTTDPTSTTLDCVVAGTCSEGPGDSATATTDPTPTEADGAYLGFPVGFTDDGYPLLGDPDAPVTLVEFSDYLCPFCGRHFQQTTPQLLEQYGLDGQVNFVFRDFPLAELHPTAPSGHAAALCVAEQGAALFWAMHHELFDNQGEWASLTNNSDYLAGLAAEIGADLDAYQTCMDSGRTVPIVEQRVTQGRQLGFSGTPSFHIVDNRTEETVELVGAQPVETFVATIDAVIAGEAPVAADQPDDAPDLPFWANAEGLAPDPDRPGYNRAGDAYRGDPDAELVVIEVSDFQCPFCQRHTLETQALLDEAYVDTGEVMWVFKHLPLQSHPQALGAAAAAECAGDQGAFWEMHDLLFERVDDWAVDPPDAALTALAGELGLDTGTFESCVASRAALERVVDDLYDMSGIFGSTPTFVVLFDGRASVIEGAQPFEQFAAAFEGILGQ